MRAAAATGDRCERWDECADGWCDAQPGCVGACRARSPLGGACGNDRPCVDGAYCPDDRCVPRVDVGGACAGWQACRDGLFCDGFDPGNESTHDRRRPSPGRCAPPRDVGGACSENHFDVPCRQGLFCDWGAEPPTCEPRLAAGAACRVEDACADGLACTGLRLAGRSPYGDRYGVAASGRCAPFLDAGGACEPDAFVTGCPGVMTCDRATRACRSTGNEGDPCASSWQQERPTDAPLHGTGCFGSLYCDPRTLRCRPQLPLGARCVAGQRYHDDEPCLLGECDPAQGRCVRPRERCAAR